MENLVGIVMNVMNTLLRASNKYQSIFKDMQKEGKKKEHYHSDQQQLLSVMPES